MSDPDRPDDFSDTEETLDWLRKEWKDHVEDENTTAHVGMTTPRRSYGKCANCKDRFYLSEPHVSYGGLLWCSENCLAEFVVEAPYGEIDVEKVESEMEHRP